VIIVFIFNWVFEKSCIYIINNKLAERVYIMNSHSQNQL